MDRDHRLDAPDNDSLSTIEQLSDRSELTTIYPRAHKEWEGAELTTRDERERQREQERLRISLSLRKEFFLVGVCIPLPFIILSLLTTLTTHYISMQQLGFLFLPVLIAMGGLIFAGYKAFKFGYKLFYNHGVRAWPFIFILLSLLAMSINATFLLTEPLHTGEEWIDMLVVAGGILVLSVVYSHILTFAWSSPRLRSGGKVGVAALLALAIGGTTAALHFL